jgi:acyl carrier protein
VTQAENSIQDRIIRIWSEILGEDDIAPDDDFFDLGGSSIAAIRIIPRISDEFGVEAEIGLLFDNPTPAELSNAILTLAK